MKRYRHELNTNLPESKRQRTGNALIAAIKSNDMEAVKNFSQTDAINERDIDGLTPLHWAVRLSLVEIVKIFVSGGVDINAKDNFGNTPLHYAVSNCPLHPNEENALLPERQDVIMGLLVDNGADPHIQNIDGKTPYDNMADFLWGFIKEVNFPGFLPSRGDHSGTYTKDENAMEDIPGPMEKEELFEMIAAMKDMKM